MTNHPNGAIYTNQGGGVVKLDANTGAHLAGPFGPGGNALGISVDPQTGNLVYVGSGGTIFFVDPGFTTSGTFSNVTNGNFVDGIAFDPTGNFLFLANRSPSFRLTIVNRSGALVQHVPMTSEPDGISFHATTPKFVITNNLDGTITRFDFPNDDYTQPPVQSLFASGGFRGDLSQVGADGCVYITQDGTRYNNGVVTGQNSLVRICGGFAPPPGVGGDGPDLTVTKDPKPNQPAATRGGTFSYIIKVKNVGNQPTPSSPNVVKVVDTLPAGTSFVFWWASQGRCTSTGPTVECDLGGGLAPGGEITIEIRVRLPQSAGTITNTVRVDPLDRIKESNEGNNSASYQFVLP
jgi:uncharacterized repeat protein (TIGR01451 family)